MRNFKMSKKIVVKLNVLAKDLANAKAITEATRGNVFVGVMVKNYPTLEEAIQTVRDYKEAGVPVSVGLGAGDPNQWKKVVEVSVQTKPPHINQVFPAVGYTIGAMEQVGGQGCLVNALISPTGTPGKVSVLTGPKSQDFKENISCEAAIALLNDIGVQSVKFYPIEGDKRLDELSAVVKAAVAGGITMIEPTGGIDAQSVRPVVETCLAAGAEIIVPHIYTAFVDKETGATDPAGVAKTTEELLALVNG